MLTKAAQSETQKIPKLRFPGFSGGWEEKRLGDVSERITKGTTPTTLGFSYNKNGVTFIKIESITEDGNFITDKFAHIDEDCNKALKRSQLKEGDILFSIAGALGRVALVNRDILPANTNQALAIISPKSGVSSKYIREVLRSDFIQSQINGLKVGLAQSNISLAQVSNFSIHTPSLSEQKKLIDFVGRLDEWIENLKKQKESFESYKKGLMQKIFSQEIRFKNDAGKDFPKWQDKKLGDFFEITSSKRVFESEWTKNGVPFYRAREIVKLSENGFVDNELFISNEMFEEYKSKYGAPKENDILVTGVGTIGIIYVVKSSDKFYFKDGNIVWFKNLNLINSQFVKYLFDTRSIKKQVIGNAAISTVGTFTIDNAKKVKINIPSLPEQQKIAEFLTSVDNIIESKQQQIVQAEQWEKGLTQGLFV